MLHLPAMLFDDVDAEGFEAGPEAADRALFHCVATRAEVGDLPVDEAWGILADRYPDDLRLRILSIMHDVDANGTTEGGIRDVEGLGRALQVLAEKAVGELREPFESLVVFVDDVLGKNKSDEAFRKARRTLRKFEQALLVDADERTKGDRPFAERSSPAKIDDAVLLASAKGEPKRYAPNQAFAVGDRIAHPKFGTGVVVAREEGKVEVAFEGGRKKLASG